MTANLGLVEEGQLGFHTAIENYGTHLQTAGNSAITRSQNYGTR